MHSRPGQYWGLRQIETQKPVRFVIPSRKMACSSRHPGSPQFVQSTVANMKTSYRVWTEDYPAGLTIWNRDVRANNLEASD